MFVGLFTELAEIGGVQQVGRHAGAVLADLASARSQPCELLGLNDRRGNGSFQVGDRHYSFRGFGRNKWELLARLMRIAPRLRFAYFGHVHLAPLGLVLRLPNPQLPYWIATHGVEVWEPLSPLRRFALRRAHGISSVSMYTAEQMCRAHDVDRNKSFVLPPAIDPGFSTASLNCLPVALPPESLVILTVGRLVASEPGKGVDTVIRALPKLLTSFPSLYSLVVGDGDARPRLEQLAQELGVSQRVLFLGAHTLETLKSCYARCEVFVMPSRQEGFGLVFLEAMACGKPVVAGNHGGAPEVVREGETGFLIEFGDVDAVSERVSRLLADAKLRTRMGEAGRRRVEENYSFGEFRRRLRETLEAVLGNRVAE